MISLSFMIDLNKNQILVFLIRLDDQQIKYQYRIQSCLVEFLKENQLKPKTFLLYVLCQLNIDL